MRKCEEVKMEKRKVEEHVFTPTLHGESQRKKGHF